MLSILTLASFQGHTDLILNVRIFRKVYKAMPIKFAVKIVRLKFYIIVFNYFDDVDIHSLLYIGHDLRYGSQT